MNKKVLFLSSVLTCSTLFGVPAKRGFHQQLQPDNTVISLQLTGDEFLHHYVTTDNYIVVKDTDGYYKYAVSQNGELVASDMIAHNPTERTEAEKEFLKQINQTEQLQTASAVRAKRVQRRGANVSKATGFPTTGNMSGIILLVEFPDKKFSVDSPLQAYTDQANKEGYSYAGATGSIRDYFIDQSGGKFTPHFDVVGPIMMSENMSYYGANDSSGNDLRPGEMIEEACLGAYDNHNIDFSKYDADNDGYVDFVYVVYAGYAESQGGASTTIWPHQWDLASQRIFLTLNNKDITTYACSSELRGASGVNMDGIGTFCHEFSHCLGLPDLYPTNYTNNFGMGEWDVMDAGSYNNYSKTPAGYSAYEKSCLNWLELEELNTPQEITLKELHSSNQAYIIYSEKNKNEYFILENRQKTNKWDASLPASGMLITHVDYLKSAWESNTINNTYGHQRVSLVPADNQLLIYNYNDVAYVNSLYGDPYPGSTNNTSFTDTSTPAAKLYTGGYLGKPITSITHNAGVINFKFMEGVVITPTPSTTTNVSANGFTANWEEVTGATSYSLQINEVQNGELLFEENFDKMSAGTISSPHSTDIAIKGLDAYTILPGWTGSKIYQAGGVAKFGSNSSPSGKLITPAIDLSKTGNTVTIYYTAKGKSGITNGIHFALTSDAEGSTSVKYKNMNLSKEMTRYCVVLEDVTNASYLKIVTNEVAYLDDLKIYSGDMSLREPQQAKARAASFPMLIENITTTSYEVSDLAPETTYAYKVKAHTDNGESEWSSAVMVTTLVATGIDNTRIHASIRVIDNQIIVQAEAGHPLTVSQANGINLFTGHTTSEPLAITADKGIYIVQVAGKSTKVVITK